MEFARRSERGACRLTALCIINLLWELFSWARELNLTDQRAFILDMLQAVHSRNPEQLQECREDWRATVETLHNPDVMNACEQLYDPGDYVPWEQVRGSLDRPSGH